MHRQRVRHEMHLHGLRCGLNRRNWIELAVMTVIFAVAAIFVYKTTILTRMMLPRTDTQIKAQNGKYYVISSGDHIEQSFVYPADELLSAGTMISLDEDALGNLVSNEKELDLGTLHLEILDGEGNSLMQADYEVCNLDDEQNLVASFSQKQGGWAGQRFTIILDAAEINEEVELAIGYTEKPVEGASLTINGEEEGYNLNVQTADHQFLYWKEWSLFGAGLVYLLLLGTYLGLAVARLAPEKVFLFAGAVFAVLYLLLLPPLAVPDEEAHFKQAYHYANRILGREDAEGKVLMDLEDFHGMQTFETTPSLTEYDILKEEVFRSGREEGTKEIDLYDTQAPAITYLPGIVGILLGRILGLNGLLVMILGRICCILCYLFAMYWFIRLMPFGKAAAFVMAVLPMTIQQCCSYSYDSVVIEIAFLYMAVFFGLMYRESPLQRRQILLYLFFMVMLSICKGGAYMPLCLLTMMIPVRRFGDRRRKWVFVGCMAAVAVAAFLFGTLGYVLYVASPTAEQAADSYLAGEAYGAAGLLADPFGFLCLSVRTFFLSGDGFLETMLGMQLGWLNVFVSRIVIYGMLLLMILGILPAEDRGLRLTAGEGADSPAEGKRTAASGREEGSDSPAQRTRTAVLARGERSSGSGEGVGSDSPAEGKRMAAPAQGEEADSPNQGNIAVPIGQKAFYLIVCALSLGMVFASMFMSWTPKNSTEIAGIQGRYFLPLLPAFLLLFHSKNVVLKKAVDRKLMFLAVSLQCVAIYGILMSLERIL